LYGLRRVIVSGPSMVPTLKHADRVWVRGGARVRANDLVLARFADLDRLVIKRAVRKEGGGWWLESDNPYAGGDSNTHGPGTVIGKVVWRYRPLRRRAR
jgi:phage repressor protein C with HTH and peptisase S24 domain